MILRCRQMRAALSREHGLRISSMIGHAGIDRGLNDASQHERIESELRDSIAICDKH